MVGHGCIATVGSYRWFVLPKSRCLISHLEGPEGFASLFQSTQLQLLFINQQWAPGQPCSSSSEAGAALLPFHQEPCSALASGHCLCHGALGTQHPALALEPLALLSKEGCVYFCSWFIYVKGRILNWKYSDFWTGQRSDGCDPHLERRSYINNKLFYQLFFIFIFSYFLWLPRAHDLHLAYYMQKDVQDFLQCLLYFTSLNTKPGSHSVIIFRVVFSSFWKKIPNNMRQF